MAAKASKKFDLSELTRALAGEKVLRNARGLKVFDTVIRWSSPVDGSTMAQQPLDEYSPRSNAAQDYRAWVKEYLGEEVTG